MNVPRKDGRMPPHLFKVRRHTLKRPTRHRTDKDDTMKIIKRSGSEAVFDIEKIISAIKGANGDVAEGERMSEVEIVEAAKRVEALCEAAGHDRCPFHECLSYRPLQSL